MDNFLKDLFNMGLTTKSNISLDCSYCIYKDHCRINNISPSSQKCLLKEIVDKSK